MSVYRKTTRAVFWGVVVLLSAMSWLIMDRLDLLWDVWAQLVDSLIVLIAAFALSRLIPRWLGVYDDR
ncbi:MAG: hypothetical protein K8I27_04505 [Planctomycetes bacterium]|nr:hypothetical protein [Planctomycetota bacterium]